MAMYFTMLPKVFLYGMITKVTRSSEWPSSVNNPYQYLILDLDDTLYPRRTGLMEEIGRRILLYLTERMGFSPEESVELRKRFNVQYGTALRGLQIEHTIDPADYLHFVHDVPLQNYLALDPALGAMLSRIP